MPLPGAKRNPGKSDFFSKLDAGQVAIAQIIRPSSSAPLVRQFAAHAITIEDPEAKNGRRFERTFCLGTPDDANQAELDPAGVERCASLGPIGDTGTFVHDWEWEWYFTCFLYVHTFADVRMNRVQILTYRQGNPTDGIYRQLADALESAEDQEIRMQDALLKIRGSVVGKGPHTTYSITLAGKAVGKYAEYALTERQRRLALEKMKELLPKQDPRIFHRLFLDDEACIV